MYVHVHGARCPNYLMYGSILFIGRRVGDVTKILSWGVNWINITGKIALIKAILKSIPIFLCSTLFAPARILSSLRKEIRIFLWKGEKGGDKKFHLVKWDVVRSEKDKGAWS